MTIQLLKSEINKFSKEQNITFVEACQAMQGAAAKLGDEKMISILHDIKMEYIYKNNLL